MREPLFAAWMVLLAGGSGLNRAHGAAIRAMLARYDRTGLFTAGFFVAATVEHETSRAAPSPFRAREPRNRIPCSALRSRTRKRENGPRAGENDVPIVSRACFAATADSSAPRHGAVERFQPLEAGRIMVSKPWKFVTGVTPGRGEAAS